jgi:hypothetical protein
VYADLMSNYFDWSNAELSMCAVVQSPAGDLRTEAERQFAAFLMNINSGQLGFNDANGKPIAISPLRPVNCPGIDAETVADLMRTGSNVPALTAVTYMNVPPNPKALSGVNVGLPFFDGGAGLAYDFFGSTLNPVDHPDSFATVEVQFGGGQKAYRYLRLERASDGLAPPQGRGYLYAGFHDIPLEVRDEHGAQLEVGFVERVLTEDDGTILPLEMQPATYDSTWGPDDSELGGREYLFVCRPVYTGSEDPNFQVDGALNLGLFPALYALWSRKNNPGSIIDPFDVIRFEFGGPPRGSIDQMMIDLAGQPLSDPDVQAAYSSIVFCLEGINNHCDIPTPVLATLVQASASPDAVELAWYAPGLTSAAVQRNRGTDWVEVAQVSSSRRDRIEWTDRDVLAGERYGYRLVADGQIYSETWVDVPSTHRLALAGVQPNPSNGAANVSFSLKRRAPAKLEVMDIQGRRVARKDLSDLGPGSHVVRVPELERLPAGIYLLRLTQDRDVAIARMVRVN